MKATSNKLLNFYRMYGHLIEITTARKLEPKQSPSVTKEVFDKFDQIRAHGIGISLGRLSWFR